MTIPTDNINISHLQAEFGGTNPVSLSEYYAGGAYVSNPAPTSIYQTAPIPTSGTISLGCFKGVRKFLPVSIVPPTMVDMYGHGNGPDPFVSPGSFNYTNIHYILTALGGAPEQNSSSIYLWSWTLKPGSSNYYTANLADPQASSGSELIIPPNQPNNSVKDFIVTGDSGGAISTYVITVTDGLTSASIEIGVGLYW